MPINHVHVAAITLAVASAAIPASKILKLKAFIDKVGCVKEAAYLIRVSKGEEKRSELGGVLGSPAGEILGVTTIQNKCA
ncbi:hypothetical protein ACIPUC_13480 [Streptomyces sp. LARHCF249]